MTDRQFEEFLRNAAQDYNRPPEGTPRTEIWAEIDAARRDGWQRSQWRAAAPWWSFSRGVAATIALWVFPLALVAGGAALAFTRWTDDPESAVPISVAELGERHARNLGAQHAQNAECDDIDTRLAALNALLQMKTEQAMPILMNVLERRDACSVELRRRAVFLVSQHENRETDDVLLRAALEDPDQEVRHQAVFWLGQLSGDEAVAALESILRGSDDSELQDKVVFSLSQHGSSRAKKILRDIALDSGATANSREQAIFWLGQEGSREDVEFLMDLFDDLDSSELREKVIFSVSQASHPAAGEWLLSLARDEKESVDFRKRALFWAGQEGNVDATALRDLYDDADNAELKEHVIFVLSQIDGSDEAATVLIDIARSETDPELRERALFWLGESDSPKAARFLSDLINR